MSDGSSAKNGGSCAKEGGQSNRSLLLIPLICYTAVLLLYMLLLLLAVCCALFFIFLRAVLFPSFFPTVFSPFFFLFITWSINLLYFIVLLHMVWCAGWLLSCPLFFSSFFFSYFLFILFLLFYRTWSGVLAGLSFFFSPFVLIAVGFFYFWWSLLLSSHLPFSFSLPRCNSDPGSLIGFFFPHQNPLPTTIQASIVIARRPPAISSLLDDSHRIAPTHAASRFQRLLPSTFLLPNRKIRPTWDSNPITNPSCCCNINTK